MPSRDPNLSPKRRDASRASQPGPGTRCPVRVPGVHFFPPPPIYVEGPSRSTMLRHSLRRQLTVVLVATIMCALALNGLGLMLYDNATSQAALGQEIDAMALVVGENSAAALTFEDPRLAREAALRPSDRGPTSASRRSTARTARCSPSCAARTVRRRPPSAPGPGTVQSSTGVRVVRDICLRDGCVGSVLVETDMRRVEARRRDTLTIFFAAFVASLGLAYVLGAALQRPLVTPLRQLSLAADEVMRTERFDVPPAGAGHRRRSGRAGARLQRHALAPGRPRPGPAASSRRTRADGGAAHGGTA